MRILYLHGFNSAPRSHKAQVMARYLAERGLGERFDCPALPPRASEAISVAEGLLRGKEGPFCFVGSSLGGFYATHLAEKHDARAVILNPAIDPHVGLRAYLGRQKNLYTGEEYELAPSHLAEWQGLYEARLDPRRYLLIVETGDEVLDYRRAVERYRGAEQVVIDGGDHTLKSFPQHLERILGFAGLA